jgi:hypothetical protein
MAYLRLWTRSMCTAAQTAITLTILISLPTTLRYGHNRTECRASCCRINTTYASGQTNQKTLPAVFWLLRDVIAVADTCLFWHWLATCDVLRDAGACLLSRYIAMVDSSIFHEAILVLLESESVKMSRLRPQCKFQNLFQSQKSCFLNILYFHQTEVEITSVLPSIGRKTRNKT